MKTITNLTLDLLVIAGLLFCGYQLGSYHHNVTNPPVANGWVTDRPSISWCGERGMDAICVNEGQTTVGPTDPATGFPAYSPAIGFNVDCVDYRVTGCVLGKGYTGTPYDTPDINHCLSDCGTQWLSSIRPGDKVVWNSGKWQHTMTVKSAVENDNQYRGQFKLYGPVVADHTESPCGSGPRPQWCGEHEQGDFPYHSPAYNGAPGVEGSTDSRSVNSAMHGDQHIYPDYHVHHRWSEEIEANHGIAIKRCIEMENINAALNRPGNGCE